MEPTARALVGLQDTQIVATALRVVAEYLGVAAVVESGQTRTEAKAA